MNAKHPMGCTECGWPHSSTEPHVRSVPVTFNVPPNDLGTIAGTGYIADTPENRAALEELAIPRCREWREANPEYTDSSSCVLCGSYLLPSEPVCRHCDRTRDTTVAPYCCSAYCTRCAGLRALNGNDPALLPNDWMHRA
jgi:hypothetical protein